jgi:hypothetical protein
MRQAIGPSFLPHTSRGEFEVVILDLDVDPAAAPASLIEQVNLFCPGAPVAVLAGIQPRARLAQALASQSVSLLQPKLGSWELTSSATSPNPAGLAEAVGCDEQELGVALRRLVLPAPVPLGPAPYLLGGTPIEERPLLSSVEKDSLLAELLAYAGRFALSDEKLRRIELVTDELLLNAIYDAPRDDQGAPRYAGHDRRAPVTLGIASQVRLRWGCDGSRFAVAVQDRFGALTRPMILTAAARLASNDRSSLGLALAYAASSQLILHVMEGRFTEATSVVHVGGSNRESIKRGCALNLYLSGSSAT